MSDFGVTDQGFVMARLADVLEQIEADQRASEALGPGVVQTGDSVLGALNGIFGASVAELWEALADIYRSGDPDTAEGEALDVICAITGVLRLPARRSTVTLLVTGDEDATIPAGSEVEHQSTGAVWVTLEDVTIPAGGSAEVEAESVDLGPVQAAPESLTEIRTFEVGWDTVTNLEAAEVGRNVETDVELRRRREELLQRRGKATLPAIRASIRELDGVQEVRVFENTGLVESGGLPPKSVEAVVLGGQDQDIWDTLCDTVAGGIEAFGTEAGVVVDEDGIERHVAFSRPDVLEIHVEVTLTKNEDYPDDEGQTVKEAILAKQGGIGDAVIHSRFYKGVFQVPGVVDVQLIKIGVGAATGTDNIPVGEREIGELSIGDIEVNATDV